jgi:hypothetical protein
MSVSASVQLEYHRIHRLKEEGMVETYYGETIARGVLGGKGKAIIDLDGPIA